MKSILAHEKVNGSTKEAVFISVKKAMQNAEWGKFVKGKNIFIKINLLSHQVVPGHCTSPWVLEAILQEIQLLNARIFVGDADVATTYQVEKAAKAWGILDLCKKYGAKFVNLSDFEMIKTEFEGVVFRHGYVPKPLAEADAVISVPVLKTHSLCIMTCALKNQWGCLPKFRHNFHDCIHAAIAEINKMVKVNFVIADCTVCSEGAGPRNGTPIIVNSIIASSDRVAVDTIAARLMGVDSQNIMYLKFAKELGVGSSDCEIVGDPIMPISFKLPDLNNMPIIRWEMRLRHIPILKTVLFKTFIFSVFAWLATKYNTIVWYGTTGKKISREFMKENNLYHEEFLRLVK